MKVIFPRSSQKFLSSFAMLMGASLVLACTGCTESSTSVMPMGQDSFMLTTRGGSSEERVQQDAIFQAAEACLNNGYKSFIVIGFGDVSETAAIVSQTDGSYRWGGYSETSVTAPITKRGARLRIRCFRTLRDDAIDAAAQIAAYGEAKESKRKRDEENWKARHPFEK